MYLGRVVESGITEEIFDRPVHPYTSALLAEAPRLDQRKREFAPIKGEIPSPLEPPSGCHFHPRCPHAIGDCSRQAPALEVVRRNHIAACHLRERFG
jgi:peptide/nickel transport system ATP-binding protein